MHVLRHAHEVSAYVALDQLPAFRVPRGATYDRSINASRTLMGRGCVKTLAKISDQKVDLTERPTGDDRHLGNGFGTPNFALCRPNSKFSHRLGRLGSLADLRRVPAPSLEHAFSAVCPTALHTTSPPA